MLHFMGLVYEYDNTYLEFLRKNILPKIRSYFIYQVKSRVYGTELFMIYNQSTFVVTDHILQPTWKCTHFISYIQSYTEIMNKFDEYKRYTGEVPKEIFFCGENMSWNNFLEK